MKWIRGKAIGQGGFATVYRAVLKDGDLELAVKTSGAYGAEALKNESYVLDKIGTCPEVIRCYGYSETFEKEQHDYNLLLEFATGGSLSDEMKKHGGRLPEPYIRRHTKSILNGIYFVHSKGFIHCDIKVDNVLIFQNGNAKICDFGLAMEASEKGKVESSRELRGTPMYLAPESVNENEYDYPVDIWALGCAVAEMYTGKPIWNDPQQNQWALLLRIGGEELPEIPQELSEEGKDFLSKCLIKDPKKRWTAEMLLDHPFVTGIEVGECDNESDNNKTSSTSSPRCLLDFPNWISQEIIGEGVSDDNTLLLPEDAEVVEEEEEEEETTTLPFSPKCPFDFPLWISQISNVEQKQHGSGMSSMVPTDEESEKETPPNALEEPANVADRRATEKVSVCSFHEVLSYVTDEFIWTCELEVAQLNLHLPWKLNLLLCNGRESC
ncbi:hypothetical protein F8388_008145 [Cannabis sativa]|uniref:Protein kinase domain-containing protein n=1 Tax=Cannabis sativa TaxID=3483 RepID=A0A7J6EV17_CANSA|nr:hypothetical protein F8388_008145 [Cannabis sativa]